LKPVLLVVAGPNGAGKTTVTARLRAERWTEGVEYLNPDDVYGVLPQWIADAVTPLDRHPDFVDLGNSSPG
jgi:predicted ABC-type ATPase